MIIKPFWKVKGHSKMMSFNPQRLIPSEISAAGCWQVKADFEFAFNLKTPLFSRRGHFHSFVHLLHLFTALQQNPVLLARPHVGVFPAP